MTSAAMPSNPAADTAADEGRYLALQARDARFDGHFFTGVTSTGIYCRPVCAVRTPRRENCRFFALAAQAESAGFRPCLRCRPELAPQAMAWSVQDASGILVQQAVRLLDAPDLWPTPAAPGEGSATVARLAERLGVSDRHLRRIFEAALGVSPLQYLQTRRLLTAKQLLTDTAMPVTQVALASGFASVRRFNAAFVGHYGLNPTQLRRRGAAPVRTDGLGASSTLRLAWRPPFDVAALLAFFERRQFHGVEWVLPQEATLRRTVRLQHPASDDAGLPQETTGWFSACFDVARHQVLLQTSDSLYPVLPLVIRRVRAMLDLDADPAAINAVLHPHFPDGDGLRVPGAFDGFELAVRAVLGQQITVAAARTLGQRLVERLGEPIATPWPELHRLFPTAATLALADGDMLGQLGIVRQRQAAIVALARAVDSGALALHAGADVPSTTAALCALPGIGEWTAQYIAMRVLRWPDAFPAGDVALHKALGVQQHKNPARAAQEASQAWRPWRSYAVLRAWAAGSSGAGTPAPADDQKLSKP
ncbi:AraC family transcriptional regulator of adaptative response / DNA-3-methyladenine glycosylase II [Acidovorax delafieldii]|uniref:DNA-3-methyladenine glycosylase 2 family protein n=1 Tax=Acidovorax delafieldii TaxID=47920 RepID=UPI00285D0C9A|nr:AlkA N-terminal domain-containing protein [Acidovorax delafieldii]MDR6153436.1 AraC family transcriptional regulator of adaptative response / DNA-3-methyladenine glycosylase II [Acidovorax delafieldii]